MRFLSTPLPDAILIEPERYIDERGYFARTFCEKEFEKAGISFTVKQENTSFNPHAGTLRGMHFQKAPKSEPKLVRCTQGKVYDVIIDLRKDSSTHCKWYGVELSQENGLALYVPQSFAHGFITLEPDSEVLYLMGEFYDPEYACGVRWNDSAFAINWIRQPEVISEKDSSWAEYNLEY